MKIIVSHCLAFLLSGSPLIETGLAQSDNGQQRRGAQAADVPAQDKLALSVEQLRNAVGRWSVVTEFLNEDGTVARTVKGSYQFEWVVPDRVVMGRAEIPEMKNSSAILFYVSEKKMIIEMVSVHADGHLWIMTGPLGGETRYTQKFKSTDGKDSQLRFTRFNVSADSFESKMEYTEDGGKTWKPGNHQVFIRQQIEDRIKNLSQEDPITEVSIERAGCYGPCPVYKAVLRRDGLSMFIGGENAKRTGKYKARIDKGEFDRLAEFLSSRGFFALKDKYSEGWVVQDIPTITTSAVRSGKRKTVKRKTLSDNGPKAAPAELMEIEKAIDAAVEQLEWEKAQ